jgi:hypothetical protein
MRQALSGMLWTKQYYMYDVDRWLGQHGISLDNRRGQSIRNIEWFHMSNEDIISMPDKWEYPVRCMGSGFQTWLEYVDRLLLNSSSLLCLVNFYGILMDSFCI